MASYNNIEDILKQFELQIVQALHYKKSETFTKTEIQTLINTAIAGVNQFGIVKSTQASNTPYGVTFTPTGGTAVTGSLTAANADAHTVYFVPSTNGTDDVFDEYMAINGAWEKIGNTDVNLTNYVQKTTTVNGHALSSNVEVTKGDVGLGNVTNVATESTITQNSTKNITSGAVYTEVNKAVSSSSKGVALGGTVNAPTVTVTPGSIVNNNDGVVTGGQVYTYSQPKSAYLTALSNLIEAGNDGAIKVSSNGSISTVSLFSLPVAEKAHTGLSIAAGSASVTSNEDTIGILTWRLRHDDIRSAEFLTFNQLVTNLNVLRSSDLELSDSDFTTMLSELNS